ncbi:MAG: acylphosphatase [Phycisphaeraceae bacterium]
MTRYTVHYAGRVQGVGFRYSAVSAAAPFTLAGYVQNLPDGRVRLVVEGEPDQLDGCLEALNEAMAPHIQSRHVEKQPATGEFGKPTRGGLTVRY